MASKRTTNRTPSSLDRQIGARIRARRGEIGVSQTSLAEAIGVTFQQVQKYESGTNRVAATTLLAIARALETPVTSLYPELSAKDLGGPPANSQDMIELSASFSRLEPAARRMLLTTARALVAQGRGKRDKG